MTTSDNIAAIEKALEGVTPGPWQTKQTRTDIQRLTVVGPSEVVVGMDGICEPDRMNDRSFAEDDANMRYIAACSPDRMSSILAEARKAEALKREIAEKDARIAALEDALRNMMGCYDTPLSRRRFPPDDFMNEALTIARTLLNGGSDAQG